MSKSRDDVLKNCTSLVAGMSAYQFVELRTWLYDNLKRTKQKCSMSGTAETLFNYDYVRKIKTGGKEKYALHAMYDFLKWGQGHGMSDDEILGTIVHDLNGMHDICFCPRTSTY
jgi:hypothetical protein